MIMQICRKCGVSVSGNKSCCPLCQGKLIGEPCEEAYPVIPVPKYSRNFIFRLITFAAVTVSVIVYALNTLIDPEIKWSIIVILGVFCAWVTSTVAVWYRKRVLKIILWELILVAAMCFAWDINTAGELSWSVDYVLPCICGAALISTFVISLALKYPPQESLIYLFSESICGIVPFILVITDVVSVRLPSVICSAICAVFLAAMLLFTGRSTGSQVKRKFHL